ncbi:hypothetical protein VN12_21265 [Pirellula sp. SH-Sr6A]|uniref:hypothetical protein n=1 Tax=Pirellula sp. SH-Sr6A TaxID=1632865 RepID=UPI00078E32DC|nr:hypothetical protein [Pirellula sp. SH-Sr6A]AMV34669.1 hypothetical protein VN12_21265 [Pirellula sp. SH-Sr6A]
MSTEPADPKSFVSNWMEKAKSEASLNQDMIALLESHEKSGTSNDDAIFRALLKDLLKKEVPSDVH